MNLSVEKMRKKFNSIKHLLNERSLRAWCAAEAKKIGWGGITFMQKVTGVSRSTIQKGLKEIEPDDIKNHLDVNRIRNSGGGRKKITTLQPSLIKELNSLIEPAQIENLLRWTCKSTITLTKELNSRNYNVSQKSVYNMLKNLGYNLHSSKKNKEGHSYLDRNAQFEYISNKTKEFQNRNQPVISVDVKKHERIGEFKNKCKKDSKSQSAEINVNDFPDKKLVKVTPYGIFDITHNKNWASMGISCNTAEFATETIKRWWKEMGQPLYPNAREILITAYEESNRLWKIKLQELANELNISINMCHLPPVTSKWNKVEHKMFSFIAKNLHRRQFIDQAIIVELINNNQTNTALEIQAMFDERKYEKVRNVSDQELDSINIQKADFHGEWNYRINPTN